MIRTIYDWGDEMATAASEMLRRGEQPEISRLRELVQEWSERWEPIHAEMRGHGDGEPARSGWATMGD